MQTHTLSAAEELKDASIFLEKTTHVLYKESRRRDGAGAAEYVTHEYMVKRTQERRRAKRTSWTFLTNHARVLLAVFEEPQARMRDLAKKSRITERAVQKIIKNLVDDGYLTRSKIGRGNVYDVKTSRSLSDPTESYLTVGSLITLLSKSKAAKSNSKLRKRESTTSAKGSAAGIRRAKRHG